MAHAALLSAKAVLDPRHGWLYHRMGMSALMGLPKILVLILLYRVVLPLDTGPASHALGQ